MISKTPADDPWSHQRPFRAVHKLQVYCSHLGLLQVLLPVSRWCRCRCCCRRLSDVWGLGPLSAQLLLTAASSSVMLQVIFLMAMAQRLLILATSPVCCCR